MQDAGQSYQSPIYFIVIVLFGGFFMMNLILAAIMDSFEKVDKEMEIEELRREFKEVEIQAQRSL
jgi:Ion transport protein